MPVTGKRKEHHNNEKQEPGRVKRTEAGLPLNPDGQLNHAHIRHRRLGFADDDVIHQDPGYQDLHHDRSIAGDQDQSSTKDKPKPVGLQPSHQSPKQMHIEHSA